jgi:hypothetical protein
MDGNESMPTLPAVEGTLDKYGKMIDYQNAMLQNFQPTITLPSKPIAVGETWESLISVPVQGQNVPLLLDAKIEKLVDYENKKAIHITYSGTKDNIDISGSTYKAEIKGSMYFDNELGMYIKVNSSYLYYSKINNQWEHIMTIDVTTNFKKILQ